MAIELDMRSADFGSRFDALLHVKRESAADIDAVVAGIIEDVRARGDEALAEFSLRFDRVNLGTMGLAIGSAEIDAAIGACEPRALEALEFAHTRVRDYHERQKPGDLRFTDALGVELGWLWRPIEAVGLYVPGGAASYPSSVVMNAVPAKVAGCRRLAMVVPTPDGRINPLVLAAARIVGVDEIYRVGGAQAVAALAYGTRTIPPVAKIVGPGNAYVAAAKRRVFGVVGIDMIAGPSEIVILADSSANPGFVAADLLAQAEHDEAAQSILITDTSALARAAAAEVERQLVTLPREKIARASWRDNGAIILCPNIRVRLAAHRAARSGAPRNNDPHPRGDCGENRKRWRDLPRVAYAGGDRRLRRRLQSCAADCALGAFLLGTRSARFHEAHFRAEVRRAIARGPWAASDHARRGRVTRGALPLRVVAPLRGSATYEAAVNAKAAERRDRLSEVFLDEDTIPRGAIDVDHERAVAIFDLIEENSFGVPGHDDGPYTLTISQEESKLTFDVRTSDGEQAISIVVSMTPFRPLLKDYFMVCETYYSAIRTASPRQIEAIDRERTKLHNEGAELMAQRLAEKSHHRSSHGASALHAGLDPTLEGMNAGLSTKRISRRYNAG